MRHPLPVPAASASVQWAQATAEKRVTRTNIAYDVAPILEAVARLDFSGSVGLQGYSISGDIAAKLAGSKQAWDTLVMAIEP